MTCNGHNHRPNCQCNFKGGHKRSIAPPPWRAWSPSTARSLKGKPNATCPRCHARVYFIAPKSGGGTYFDCFGPPWKKHPCTDPLQNYSPFNSKGIPKLKALPAEFEKDGWLPIIIRNVETLAIGHLIHAQIIDSPNFIHLGLTNQIAIDCARPIFYRKISIEKKKSEINFFAVDTEFPTSESVFADCDTELEFRLRLLAGH